MTEISSYSNLEFLLLTWEVSFEMREVFGCEDWDCPGSVTRRNGAKLIKAGKSLIPF